MENTDAAAAADDDDHDHDHHLRMIPGDVLIQILVGLPVKSMLRFKSVCKSWLSLIESSFSIHLHATMLPSSSSNKFGTFIFQTSPSYSRRHYSTKATEIFMLSSSSRSGGGGGEDDDDEVVVLEVEDLELPPLYNNLDPGTRHDLLLVGSCNGLVCLYDSAILGGGDISLWNPATRQFRLLPKSSLTFIEEEGDLFDDGDRDDFVGFGFDVKTKDYKVFQITFCEERIFGVQVYSLSTDSWRLLEEGGRVTLFAKQVQGLDMEHGLYLNGSYFFEANYLDMNQIGHLILSFDFTQEIFTTMQLPDKCDPNSTLIVMTTYLGDKIALFTKVESSSREGVWDDCNIWVLNEHHGSSSSSCSSGVNKEESSSYWTKLQQHSFRMKNNSQWTIPRGISNNGEFAFIETGGLGRSSSNCSCSNGAKDWKLQLFNLVTKEIAKIEFPIGKKLGIAHVYKPSLVSIIGGGNGAGAGAGAAAANRVIGNAI